MPTRTRIWKVIGISLLVLIALLVLAGLFAVSYRAALVYFAALPASVILVKFFKRVLLRWKDRSHQATEKVSRGHVGLKQIPVAGVAVIAVVLLIFLILNSSGSLVLFNSKCVPDPNTQPLNLKTYRLIVEATNVNMDHFKLTEVIGRSDPTRPLAEQADPDLLSLPERDISSTSRGWFLREVRINPLQADSTGCVRTALPDGKSVTGFLCRTNCPASDIELPSFPKGAFYETNNVAKDVNRAPYLNGETVTWSARNLNSEIAFTFIRPPYYYLRPIIAPFATVGSWGTLAGVILGLIWLPLGGIIGEFLKTKAKSIISKLLGRETNQEADKTPKPK